MKMFIDITMTVLSIIQMGGAVLFPDERVHQILGITLLIFWIIHIVLHRRWYGTMFKGKYNPYRIMQTIVNLGIAICALLLMFSGLSMAWFWPSGFLLDYSRIVHLATSHWYFLFMCAHLGLHISMIADRIHLNRFTVAVVCIYGFYAFIIRGLWRYMFLTQQFFFLDLERGYFLFAIDYISILVMFAVIFHMLAQAFKRRRAQ